jgi:CheY-like chemotaxis protein
MTNQQHPSSVVLVVEDEEMLRSLALDLVEDAGFEAFAAVNADQAIAILDLPPTARSAPTISHVSADED